jgi:hypothetical protein
MKKKKNIFISKIGIDIFDSYGTKNNKKNNLKRFQNFLKLITFELREKKIKQN